MTGQGEFGSIDDATARLTVGPLLRPGPVVRWALPLSWVLAAVGYFGPWVAHETAALTITGVDMAEFVKFLPGVAAGSPAVYRQLFYLPPLAVVAAVAFLVGSRELKYPWPLQALFLGLGVPVSLQLLPPAWSPGTLTSPEFRLQTAALALSWLLLASFWLLARLPLALRSALPASLALAAIVLPAWQFTVAKPAIDRVYGQAVGIGWGALACLGGLSVLFGISAVLLLADMQSRGRTWAR